VKVCLVKTLLFLGGPIAVPVFMLVMGYFLAKNQKPFTTNFFRGIKIILVGLLLNIGLNFLLLLKIQFAGWQLNPWEYIFGVDIFYFAGWPSFFFRC
jgi:surface polysaccharide O-acyltransferase-like enzyme